MRRCVGRVYALLEIGLALGIDLVELQMNL